MEAEKTQKLEEKTKFEVFYCFNPRMAHFDSTTTWWMALWDKMSHIDFQTLISRKVCIIFNLIF